MALPNRFGRRNVGNFGSVSSRSSGGSQLNTRNSGPNRPGAGNSMLNAQLSRGGFLRGAGLAAGAVAAAGLGFGGVARAQTGPTTWYVAIGGSNVNPGTPKQPFETIQHAVNVANAGDTIRVMPGEHVGAIIDKKLTLIGVGDVFITSPDPDNFVDGFHMYLEAVEDGYGNIVGTNVDGTWIENFAFRGNMGAAVGVDPAENIIAKKITLTKLRINYSEALFFAGLWLTVSESTITHNTMTLTLSDKSFLPFQAGILFFNWDSAPSYNNLIAYNKISCTPPPSPYDARVNCGIVFFALTPTPSSCEGYKIIHNKISWPTEGLMSAFMPAGGIVLNSGCKNCYVGYNDLRGSTIPIDLNGADSTNTISRNLGDNRGCPPPAYRMNTTTGKCECGAGYHLDLNPFLPDGITSNPNYNKCVPD